MSSSGQATPASPDQWTPKTVVLKQGLCLTSGEAAQGAAFFILLTLGIIWLEGPLSQIWPHPKTGEGWSGWAWPAREVGRKHRAVARALWPVGVRRPFSVPLVTMARLASTLLLQETLGPSRRREPPLELFLRDCWFWPVGRPAVTPQMLQPIHYDLSVSI